MSLHWINKQVLGESTTRVVKRADYEQVMSANEVLAASRELAAAHQVQLNALQQETQRVGYAAGIEMGKRAWARELVERHHSGRAQLCDLNGTLVEAVMRALRHLLGQLPAEIQFERLAEQVLKSVVRARQMRLVVAPTDVSVAWKVLERWQREHPEAVSVDVVVDDALTAGDCVLETDEGAVDGRLSQRLAQIEGVLTSHLAAVPSAVPGQARPRATGATGVTA